MVATGFVTHPTLLQHDSGPHHPERPERIGAIMDHLDASGTLDRLIAAAAGHAESKALERVHTAEHVERIRALSNLGRLVPVSGDTAVSPDTFEAAALASGGVVKAIDEVIGGSWDNAFCAHRPPGHHAETATAMGFCYFNHVAVGARHAQAKHGIERVAIIDWDVHHGNGTQHTFYDDPTVFFFSVHQFPLYPGTGAREERGAGSGTGTTMNRPLPAGAGDGDYSALFAQELVPAINSFEPELILLSAGFDAHERDPLGGMELTTNGYRDLTTAVKDLAARHCSGRLVSLLEGGYDLDGTASAVNAHLEVMSG